MSEYEVRELPAGIVAGQRLRVNLDYPATPPAGWSETAPGVFERIADGHEAPTVVFTKATNAETPPQPEG